MGWDDHDAKKESYDMRQKMTVVSQGMFDHAVSGMNIEEAVCYLEKEAKIRSFREKLQKAAPEKDLKPVLIEGLLKNDPGRKKEAVERLVRGWLNADKSVAIDKEKAIELCFILGLSYDKAEQLVLSISEEGFHWRNPSEIAYIFALKNGMTYQEAQELEKKAASIPRPEKESKNPLPDSFTPIIRNEIYKLRTEEELLDYIRRPSDKLGQFHNTAYHYFKVWLKRLQNPQDELVKASAVFKGEDLSLKDVLREYMFQNNVRNEEQEAEEDYVRKIVHKYVRKNWPNEAGLSKMSNRRIDVTRKVLILLFLATAEEPEDDEFTAEDIFEDMYQRLNDMLISCGFSTLDPRSPFDWLIMYGICAQNLFDMDSRLRDLFKEMFGELPED